MATSRRALYARAAKRRLAEDDPRWIQTHGPGYQRKVGANVTMPRAYVTGGSRRGRTSRGT